MRIVVKKGLDVPLDAKPLQILPPLPRPKYISLNLNPFEHIRFKLLVDCGDKVKIGTPLVENKAIAGQNFVSPASGTVVEIRRGAKRRLLDIVVALDGSDDYLENGVCDVDHASQEEICAHLLRGGAFAHIRMRPFDLIANPTHIPRDIFVRAVETLPFTPPAAMQVEGHEKSFQIGLNALKKLTTGAVHLVYHENETAHAILAAQNVTCHTVCGPHPAGTSSLHIHYINPIKGTSDIVWTLSAHDVVVIGKLLETGRYHVEKVVGMGGDGIRPRFRGFVKVRSGYPVEGLLHEISDNSYLISGDPLTGTRVEKTDFLNFYHTSFSVIPQNTTREMFHFLRLGLDKYSCHKAYYTGHVKPPVNGYPFTTNQHGEERAFVDGGIYRKVMPMRIPTMELVKAVLGENFELAMELGLLEVTADDFALATFICPSKVEMIDIMKQGLHRFSVDMGY